MARLGRDDEIKELTSTEKRYIIDDKYTRALEVLARAIATRERGKVTIYLDGTGKVSQFELARYY